MDEARAGFSGEWRGLSGCGGVTPAKQWGVGGRWPLMPSPVTMMRLQSVEAAKSVMSNDPQSECISFAFVWRTEFAWSAGIVTKWQSWGTYW